MCPPIEENQQEKESNDLMVCIQPEFAEYLLEGHIHIFAMLCLYENK